MTRCYLIAELGCNHCGDVNTALRMVDVCAVAGVDAVKLQIRDVSNPPDEWSKPYSGPHSYGATYLEHRRALELSVAEYEMVAIRTRALGMEVGASIWDERAALSAVDELLDFDWYKIPSAMLTHRELLVNSSSLLDDMSVILSTGMSTADEVDEAVSIVRADEHPSLTLLHCTSTYPCANEDVHLEAMRTLQRKYLDCKVGISGHWRGIQIDAAAVALGAEVIERHMTLDRTMKGTDHAASLEPGGLAKWVRDVRAVEAAMGSPEIQVLPCEESARRKLRVW